MNHPALIILDVEEGVQTLKKELSCLSLPHVDLDVLLDKTVDALIHQGESAAELLNLSVRMLCGDGHREAPRVEHWNGCEEDTFEDVLEEPADNLLGLESVAQSAQKFGQELLRTLKAVKLFEEDYLKYEYAGMLDDRSLVLRRK